MYNSTGAAEKSLEYRAAGETILDFISWASLQHKLSSFLTAGHLGRCGDRLRLGSKYLPQRSQVPSHHGPVVRVLGFFF